MFYFWKVEFSLCKKVFWASCKWEELQGGGATPTAAASGACSVWRAVRFGQPASARASGSGTATGSSPECRRRATLQFVCVGGAARRRPPGGALWACGPSSCPSRRRSAPRLWPRRSPALCSWRWRPPGWAPPHGTSSGEMKHTVRRLYSIYRCPTESLRTLRKYEGRWKVTRVYGLLLGNKGPMKEE